MEQHIQLDLCSSEGYDIHQLTVNDYDEDNFDYRNLPYVAFPNAFVNANDDDNNIQNYSRGVNIDYLLCPICKAPFVKPYVTKCGHTFCYDCIVEALKITNQSCPLDKVRLMKDVNQTLSGSSLGLSSTDLEDPGEIYDISPAPLIIKVLSDDLCVKCLNYQRGCTWTGMRTDIKEHVIRECQFTRVPCGKLYKGQSYDEAGRVCKELIERRHKTGSAKCHHNLDDAVENQFSSKGSDNIEANNTDTISPSAKSSRIDSAVIYCPNARIGCDWKFEITDNYFQKFDRHKDIVSKHIDTFCRYEKLHKTIRDQDLKIEQMNSHIDRVQNKFNWLINSIPHLNRNETFINNFDALQNVPSNQDSKLSKSRSRQLGQKELEEFNNEILHHGGHSSRSSASNKQDDLSLYVKQLVADNVKLNDNVSHLMATVNGLQMQMSQLSFSYKQQQIFHNEIQRIHSFQQHRFSGERLSVSTNDSESDLSDGLSSGRVKL